MKIALLTLVVLLASVVFADLPPLNKICRHTFQKPYGCGGDYSTSGLNINAGYVGEPVLLYAAACGSQAYATTTLSGDDFGLISEIGPYKLEDATASKLLNWNRTVGEDNIYANTQPLKENTLYSVVISRANLRAMLAFYVVGMEQDGNMTIDYAVINWVQEQVVSQAGTFDWSATNVPGSAATCFSRESQDLQFSAYHAICPATLTGVYSCKGTYATSALFLSRYNTDFNYPDILLNGSPQVNGSCARLDFEAALAGDDMTMISDLGNVPIASVSAVKAFNYVRTVGHDSNFTGSVLLEPKHTYALMSMRKYTRSLLVFSVDSVSSPDTVPVQMSTVSLLYELTKVTAQAPGFDWTKPNSPFAPGTCPA